MPRNQSVPKTISKGYGLAANFLQNFLPVVERLEKGLNLLLQDPHPYQYFRTKCNSNCTHCYRPEMIPRLQSLQSSRQNSSYNSLSASRTRLVAVVSLSSSATMIGYIHSHPERPVIFVTSTRVLIVIEFRPKGDSLCSKFSRRVACCLDYLSQ